MKRNNLVVFSGAISVSPSPPTIQNDGEASAAPYKDFSIHINESETAAAIALGRPAIELWAFTQASRNNQVVATIVGKLRTCAGETVVVADTTTFHVGMPVRRQASQLINAMFGDGACQEGEPTTEILVPGQQQTWIGGKQPGPINLVVLDGILIPSNGGASVPPPYHQFFIQTDAPEKGGKHAVFLQDQDQILPCLKSKETRQAAVFGSLRFLSARTVVLAHQVLVSEPSYE